MDDIMERKMGMCRFLQEPFQDCFCMNLTGSKIPKVTAFCAGDYQACAVYRREIGAARGPESCAAAGDGFQRH